MKVDRISSCPLHFHLVPDHSSPFQFLACLWRLSFILLLCKCLQRVRDLSAHLCHIICSCRCFILNFVQASTVTTSLQQLLTLLSVRLNVLFYVSHFCSYYSCHVTEAEGEVGIP